jgi:hypothetical protein
LTHSDPPERHLTVVGKKISPAALALPAGMAVNSITIASPASSTLCILLKTMGEANFVFILISFFLND